MKALHLYVLLALLHLSIINAYSSVTADGKITISGLVIDQENESIIAASVCLTCGDKSYSTVTDLYGKFKINASINNAEMLNLQVSYIGFKIAKETFYVSTLNNGQNFVRVTLVEDIKKNKKVDSSIATIKPIPTTKTSIVTTPAKSIYDIASEDFNAGNYDKALQILQDAILEDDDPRLRNLLGLIYLEGKGVEKDYNKALEHLMIAAVKGDKYAEYNLGCMYAEGFGVNKDIKKAFEWYLKSAEHGDISAQNRVGLYYDNGIGTDRNYLKAAEWYRKAADQNNKYALYNLGMLYANGYGVPQDDKKAFELYGKSATNGLVNAEYALATCYRNGKGVLQDDKKALEWYKKAAEHNNVEAQNTIGWMYECGIGTSVDIKKAAEWYLKSAEQGYYIGQWNIAKMYEEGLGVNKDIKKAFEWYLKSASQGYGNAECYVASMYQTGFGVKQNYQEAVKWYEKAVEHDNFTAQFNLACIYFDGINGIPKNIKRAITLMEKAAQSGNAEAQWSIGFMLSEDTSEKDYPKALEWTQKSASQDYSPAINDLGWFYEHGYGVPVDLGKAVEFYRKAADKDNASGLSNLGRMYENGYGGLSVNYKQALELYRKAADKDNYKAMRHIANMYEKGLGVEKDIAKAISWYDKAKESGDTEARQRLEEFNQRLSNNLFDPVPRVPNDIASNPSLSLPSTPKRIALIIGNDDYGSQRLENPVNDARALNDVLKILGFETSVHINLNKDEMEDIIAQFAKNANNYDMALFFYAGHAIQSDDINYLIPACPERVLNKADVKRKYVDLPFIINSMMYENAKRNIIILDACRDTPDFIGINTRGGKRGLANIAEPKGFLIAYSTQAGKTAADGTDMKHSPYTTVLLEQLKEPGLNVDQLFVRVRDYVQELTHDEQCPFYKNNLSESPREKFYFNRGN